MPTYSYECTKDNCPGTRDLVRKIGEAPKHTRCFVCGSRSVRVYTAPQLSVFKPYVTPDITGEDVEVTCASQEDALCKQYGVTRLLSTDMTGSRDEVKKKRARRWKEHTDKLGDFEKQYQKHTAVSVSTDPA